MSGLLVGDVLDGAPFKGNTLMVLIALAENADTETGICYPSNQLLAWRTRQSGRNVRNCIRELVEGNWIAIVPGAGARGTNVYRLNVKRLAAEAAERREELKALRQKRFQGAVDGLEKAVEEAQQNLFITGAEEQQGAEKFSGGAETAASGEGGNSSFRRTVMEPSVEPSREPSPTPPAGRGEEEKAVHVDGMAWGRFRLALRQELCDAMPLGKQKRMPKVIPGAEDFETCFRDWWLDRAFSTPAAMVLCTSSADPVATLHGLEKYSARVQRLSTAHFGSAVEFRVTEPP